MHNIRRAPTGDLRRANNQVPGRYGESMGNRQLLAGAAQVDITAPPGTHLSGAVGQHRPAEGILEPLWARALVLRSGDRTLCLIVLDVTIVTEDYSVRLREAAVQLTGCRPQDALICATQTHSAPSLGHFMVDPDFPELPDHLEWLRGTEAAYSEWALAEAVAAVQAAAEDLEPVQMAVGSGVEGRLAHNRRGVDREGKVRMPPRYWDNPLGPTWLRYLEGPIDPEVGVIAFRREDGRLKAMLVHHTCHPVHVFPQLLVSPDWPGALCDVLQEAHQGCVPLVLNGACGNINPWPPFEPDYDNDHRRMGKQLAEVVERVIPTLEFRADVMLDATREILPLPFRQIPPEELARVEAIVSSPPEWADEERKLIDSEWVVAASIWSVHLQQQREGKLPYAVQVLRLGDSAVVGLPGEPFVEGQLAIKIGSPTYPTYLAHCTGQYVGYIPTQAALQRGGHEVHTRYWAKLQPEALDSIVAQALKLLADIFPSQGDQP